MFLKIWKDYMQRRTFSYFLLVVLVLFGFLTLNLLPKESSPDIQVPIAIILTPYPGATAEQVEEITNDIEKASKNISDIDKITSTSSAGYSSVVVTFKQGADVDGKIDELKEEIDKIDGSFPKDVMDTDIHDIKFSDAPVYTFSIATNQNKYDVRKISDDLVDIFEDVQGVSGVSVSGISDYEISINLNQLKIKQYNLTLGQIQSAIIGANINLPLGDIEIENQSYILSSNIQIDSVEDLEKIPVMSNGKNVVYLKDIAEIKKDLKREDVNSNIFFPDNYSNQKSVVFGVSKEKGFNIIQLTEALGEKLEELKKDGNLLQGIDTVVTMDLGHYAKRDMWNLSQNGLMAVILVFIVLIFVLGLKNAFVAAIGIPISFLLAFIFFYFVGNTLNYISLFSMILAIGILVDSDIVITEGIAQRKEKLKKEGSILNPKELEMEASVRAVKDLAGPMLAGTATTIAVFSPLLFLTGVTGDFIKNIPFTVIFILLASQIVSIFVVPLMHSSEYKMPFGKFFKKLFWKNKKESFEKKKNEKLFFDFSTTKKKYLNLLDWIFKKKSRENWILILVIFSFLASLYLPFSGAVKSDFFPGGDVPLIFINAELDRDATRSDLKKYLEKIKEKIVDKKYYSSVIITLGQTSEFAGGGKLDMGDRFGNILINIKEDEQKIGKKYLNELREELSNFEKITMSAPEGGPPGGAPIDFNIIGGNFDTVKDASLIAENILLKTVGVINIKSSLDKNFMGIEFEIDQAKANIFGVNLQALLSKVSSITKGNEILEIKDKNEAVKIYLKNNLSLSGSQEKINSSIILNSTIKNNKGEDIYLSFLMRAVPKSVDSEIFHYDRKNSLKITAEIEDGYELVSVVEKIQEEFKLKNNTSAEIIFGGSFDQQQNSFGETGLAFMAGILLIFGILIFLFNSYRLPLIIESVIPLAFTGVVVGLWITGSALSFPSILGFVALSGIVVNNSIILIYVYEELRKKKKTISDILDREEILEIVKKGSISRIRPIILTTITTILGVAPLITASAMWAPIAYTIIFGLLFATVITLIFIPIIYKKWYPKK